MRLFLLLLLSCFTAGAQPSFWFTQFQRQGNAQLAQQYEFKAGSNITFTFDGTYSIINASGGGGGGGTVGVLSNFFTTNAFTFPLALTNGFVGAGVTNGLLGPNATNDLRIGLEAYVNMATNGFVGPGVTNGLLGANATNDLNNAIMKKVISVVLTNGTALSGTITQLNFITGTNVFIGATNVNSQANVMISCTAITNGGGGGSANALTNFDTRVWTNENGIVVYDASGGPNAGALFSNNGTFDFWDPSNFGGHFYMRYSDVDDAAINLFWGSRFNAESFSINHDSPNFIANVDFVSVAGAHSTVTFLPLGVVQAGPNFVLTGTAFGNGIGITNCQLSSHVFTNGGAVPGVITNLNFAAGTNTVVTVSNVNGAASIVVSATALSVQGTNVQGGGSVSGQVLTATGSGGAGWSNATPYLKYTGQLVTDNGVGNAPTITVFENTLGQVPTWTCPSDGIYEVDVTGALFDKAKLFVLCAPDSAGATIYFNFSHAKDYVQFDDGSGGGYILNTTFEIRVYP